MKPRITLALILAAVLSCTGCGSDPYKITLRDGREFITSSRPEYIAKTGYYKYRSQGNREALIRADEILMLNEL